MQKRSALVVGATGIAGQALVARLLAQGWEVDALSRTGSVQHRGVRTIRADLTDPDTLTTALGDSRPSHVFLTAWLRQKSEQENIVVNGALVRNLLSALRPHRSIEHVALLTGLKHYLGPFEAYGKGEVPDSPFHEDEPRQPYPNFYYAQEDELFAAAERDEFHWSVHRSHTIIGAAVGNAMNMAQTIAAQAAICREEGRAFVFPGSQTQWEGLTDVTDADLLADHMIWASTTPQVANTALNTANGDVFRWRWMWPRIAERLKVEYEGFSGEPRPLETQMTDGQATWDGLAVRHDLVESDLSRVASWWHTDSDLGRDIECLTDMRRSRLAGYHRVESTLDAFFKVFDQLERDHVIPLP